MRIDADRLTGPGSPFELVDADVEGGRCTVFRHAPATLPELYKRARASDRRELLVAQGRRASYRHVFERADILTQRLLRDIRVCAGTRIGVILDNVPEWVIAFLGITASGATAVLVHKEAEASHLLDAIGSAGCTITVCDEQTENVLRGAGYSQAIITAGGLWSWFDDAERERSPGCETSAIAHHVPEISSGQVALVAFTSGSTGHPKGVELTHRSIITGLMNMLLGAAIASLDNTEGKRDAKRSAPASLVVGPLSHLSGYGNLLLSLHFGGKLVLAHQMDVTAIAGIIDAEAVTSLVGATPDTMRSLLRAIRKGGGGESLRSIVVHGTALHSSLFNEIRTVLPRVALSAGYGMTETNGSVCVASERNLRDLPETSGRPLPTVNLRIARSDGSDAAVGESGEIRLRGAMIMRGYCNDPVATQRTLQGGWLRTGDIGRVDQNGFLYVLDRASQMVECNGVQISCSSIEQAILESGLAEEVAAFGIDESTDAERLVIAFVWGAKQPADSARIAALLATLGIEGVGGSHYMYLQNLPRTVSGKIDRRELRRYALGERLETDKGRHAGGVNP